MSYEKIHETIDVVTTFQHQRCAPVVFKWKNRYYHIRDISLVYSERVGREKIYYFAVSDDGASYRLSFRTDTLDWKLEERCSLESRNL